MNELSSLPPEILLLLPLAVAAGIDLYLTLLVTGLYLFFGEPPLGGPIPLPPGSWGILPGLACLYLVETAAEIRPVPALFWHHLQLLIRPLGGLLLGVSLLWEASSALTMVGATLAALVAAFVHVLAWGQSLLLRLSPGRHVSPVTFNLAQDTFALALSVLAWERPLYGFPIAFLLLLLGLVRGAHLHRVVRFGTSLLGDRIWGILSRGGWTQTESLPAWVRRWASGVPFGGLRGLRAGALGLPGWKRFREGWIVNHGGRLSFLFRRGRRSVEVPLGDQAWDEEATPLTLRVRLRAPPGPSPALFLHLSKMGQKPHK